MDKIEVSQRAREAAADLWIAVDGDFVTPSILQEAERYRRGDYDYTPAVLAFARFERDILATRTDATSVATDVPWCTDMNQMHGVNEVTFDNGFGVCFIRICEKIITSPTLVNGFPVPLDQYQYAYRYDDDRVVNDRAIAWRPVPLPHIPSAGTPYNPDDSAKREIARLSDNARKYLASTYTHPPATDVAALVEAARALRTAVRFADPPKLFNGVLCHEARVPVEFIEELSAALAPFTKGQP